ncbi:MAG: Ppx/GppA family phosphatase [Bacillota bacterium]
MRAGVIDIGTNSTRYLLADVSRDGTVSRVETMLKTTRLGEGVSVTGRLTEQAMARTAAAAVRFCSRAKEKGAETVLLVATAAVREARNREDFLALIYRTTGLEARVLSGTEEAFYTFIGVLTGCVVNPERAAVVDVGGGSTEIIWVENERLVARSLPLGAVRLTELRAGYEVIESYLGPVCQLISGRELFGTGGTITTLAAVALGLQDYDPELVHGYQLSAGEVSALVSRFTRLSLEELKNVAGLQPERADIIVAGACIVMGLLKKTGAPGLTVSENDILYGIACEAAGAVETKYAFIC